MPAACCAVESHRDLPQISSEKNLSTTERRLPRSIIDNKGKPLNPRKPNVRPFTLRALRTERGKKQIPSRRIIRDANGARQLRKRLCRDDRRERTRATRWRAGSRRGEDSIVPTGLGLVCVPVSRHFALLRAGLNTIAAPRLWRALRGNFERRRARRGFDY